MNTQAAPPLNFDDLYRQQYPHIYRRVLSVVRHPQQAEDVTQEAFVKAWRAWPPASTTNLSGWLSRIATRTALDVLRRERLICWHSLDTASGRGDESTADPPSDSEKGAEWLDAVLSQLSARQGRLLLLSVHYTTPELAQALGVHRRTLSSYLSRLRARAARLPAQEVSA